MIIQKVCLLIVFVLSAFSANFARGADLLHVEVVSKGFQHDFWKQVKLGCDAAGKEFGATVNFVGPESESSFAEQNAQLAEAVRAGPDALCFAALSPETSLPLIYEAADAGIPIITFDSDISQAIDDEVKAFVATDNLDAGAAAAEHLYAALKDRIAASPTPVRIGVLSQDTISQSLGDRTFGFVERIVKLCGLGNTSVEGHLLYERKAAGASVIIDIGIPENAVESAMDEVAQRLLIKSDLLGMYASNEFSGKSLINMNALTNRLGGDKVVGIGFDSGVLQKQAVRDRVLSGAITQNPFMIGYLTVKTAIAAATGKDVQNLAVPYYFYTADNMDEPGIAACLYD